MNSKSRVAVFGGSGFLGSYVAEELNKRNYRVVIADLTEPEYEYSNTDFVKCDIMDTGAVDKIIRNTDIVFNFAGFSNMEKSVAQPKETVQLNVIGNINIIESCVRQEVRRYVFASSAYAFSNKGSFYGISKLASEKIVEEYYKRFNLPYTIVRYGSLYGERANEANGIYRILAQAVESGKIVFRGDGNGVREYIHAADAAVLSVDIIENEKFENEHLILTGTERLRHKDILLMVREIFDGKIEVEYMGPEREDHYFVTPYSFQPNTAKKLTLNPFIDLGQGLVRCIEYIRVQFDKNNENV